MHQYFNTVQSEVNPEHLVDTAMMRRQAMALQAHRRSQRPFWKPVLMLGGLMAIAFWFYL